ncbi:MAG: TlpA family protein disulfide reductase [candidate division KSB1 bacterium]|nr:TlpA family protein disulfide reductase [candidate division KSB1 bacterium]
MRHLKKLFVLFALGVVFASGCQQAEQNKNSASNDSQTVQESEKLPDFSLATLSGETVNLRQFEGKKIVVVNFWATWCGPCRHEIPDFNRVYSRYRDRGVEILGISVDASPAVEVPPFMEKIPIDYPVLLGSPDLTYRYGIRGLPTTIILDRDGRIRNRIVGMISASKLEAEIDKLL